jgi:hypothetical protein
MSILRQKFVGLGVSTGQKPQSPKKVIKSQVKIQKTTADKVESVPEDRLERPLKGFLKRMGWWLSSCSPV